MHNQFKHMERVLIFPAPFRAYNPALEEQNDYMISSLYDEVAMEHVGRFIGVNELDKAIYAQEIRRIITEQSPEWVIASRESATACIGLHGQKKILINPAVTPCDLNNVPEYARRHTFGFFGALQEQERSYELFQTVYPNAAWYINVTDLRLFHIKDISTAIVNNLLNE